MAAKKSSISIDLDLLKPQSSPEILPAKFLKWLLSSGRFIFILVEAIVLIAFIARFKLDSDLATKKEAIELEIPFIQSLRSSEILIRRTQLKLSTISTFHTNSPNYSKILKNLASQTPFSVTFLTLKMDKNVSKVITTINAHAKNNNDVTNFVQDLKKSGDFATVTLASIGVDQGLITFTIYAETEIGKINESRL